MELNASLTDYPEEAFEKDNVHERPAIPFRPDYVKDNKVRKMKIKVDASTASEAKGTSKNFVELQMEVFETGTFEQALKWGEKFQLVLKRKPVEDPQGKMDLMTLLTEGEARVRWDRIVSNVTVSEKHDAPVISQATFRLAYVKWLRTWCDIKKHPGRKQVTYLRQSLQKPSDLALKIWAERLLEINRELKYFEDRQGPLSDGDLIEIVVSVMPDEMTIKMRNHKWEPFEHSWLEVLEYYGQLETTADALETAIASDKEHGGEQSEIDDADHFDESDGDTKNKKRKSCKISEESATDQQQQSSGNSERHCSLCELFGGNADSHNTRQCNKRRRIRKFLSDESKGGKREKAKSYHHPSKKEYRAIVRKEIKRMLKRKRDYDSDST
jgi:hypothetical protein